MIGSVTNNHSSYLQIVNRSVADGAKKSGKFTSLLKGPIRQTAGFVVSPLVEVMSGRAFRSGDSLKSTVRNSVITAQLFGFIAVPGLCISALKNTVSMKEANRNQRINLGLDVADDARNLGSAVGAGIGALSVIKVISKRSAQWVTNFIGIMGLFAIGTVAKCARKGLTSRRLFREIKDIEKNTSAKGKATLETLNKITKLLSEKRLDDKNFFESHFGIEEDTFVKGVIDRESMIREKMNSADELEREEGQNLLDKTVNLLKGRVKSNVYSSAMAAVAGVMQAVGAVLLLIGVTAPIGLGILGIAESVEFGLNVRGWLKNRKLKLELGISKPFNLVNKLRSLQIAGIFQKVFPRLNKCNKAQVGDKAVVVPT